VVLKCTVQGGPKVDVLLIAFLQLAYAEISRRYIDKYWVIPVRKKIISSSLIKPTLDIEQWALAMNPVRRTNLHWNVEVVMLLTLCTNFETFAHFALQSSPMKLYFWHLSCKHFSEITHQYILFAPLFLHLKHFEAAALRKNKYLFLERCRKSNNIWLRALMQSDCLYSSLYFEHYSRILRCEWVIELCSVCLINGVSCHNAFEFCLDSTNLGIGALLRSSVVTNVTC